MEINRISSDIAEFVCEDFIKFDVWIKITDSKDIMTAKRNLKEFIDAIRREKFTNIKIGL